jgi:hypothetical protein
MPLGPFLRRELILSVRSSRAFADRRNAVLLTALGVVGVFLLWDYWGWDRTSVSGGHRFGLAMFFVAVAGMVLFALGVIIPQVAGAIASERDRKSLDALLASRFAGSEIVLGALAAGLFRSANALSAALPIAVLLVFLGGVAPIWVTLTGVGLASMALFVASFSVVASVEGRTGVRAVNLASGLFGLWTVSPFLFVVLRPFVWPGAPAWLTSAVVATLDSTPLGLLTNFGGLLPRPGGPAGAIFRMVAWQSVGSLALVAWAIARLRPASRGLYDVEGEATRIKQLKAAIRRPPRRPPCFDDPVLWYEVYAIRSSNAIMRMLGKLLWLAWFVALVLGIWWFARPAFEELMERGYGPCREAFSMPELNPLVRLLISKIHPTLAFEPATGQARLELNIVLRQLTGMYSLGFVFVALSAAFESVKGERRRDTWLGLIATPLTGREILRGKTQGSLWKARDGAIMMIGLWTIGLLAGAIHPIGLLAAISFLVASGAFFPALGLLMALMECNPEKKGVEALSIVHVPALLAGLVLLTVGPLALAWASLLTFEDVDAIVRSGPFIQFGDSKLKKLMGARLVVAAWLAGTAVLAVGAVILTRANARRFDEAVGRPTRPAPSVTDQAAQDEGPPG